MEKVWLNSQYHQIVYQRQHAAQMTNANAQQMMHAARTVFKDYVWQVVPAGIWFVVEGTSKTESRESSGT